VTRFWEQMEKRGAAVDEKPFGIDMKGLGPLDMAAAAQRQTLVEKARLNRERQEYEKLMPYARDAVLMGWLDRVREEALTELVKAPSADGRIYWQAAVRTVEGIRDQIANAEVQFNHISNLLDKM
jgi:hypothetical protein